MVIKVGINSFGRIGRVIFRTCCQNSEIQVTAINDPAIDLEYMCYLIKFDSTHGKYTGNVSYEGDDLKIDDSRVKVFHQKVPSDIPWHLAGVQYVVEASGMFTSLEKASGHLSSGLSVRKVIVTAPSADAPMLILGVNEDKIQPDMKVVSCASSTLYCLAPIVKILQDTFGVAEGFVTSIHAMTPSLKPLDGLCVRGKHWRDHRSIHQNIIPASTGACKALGKIIPSCKDKFAAIAFRVPIVNVSVLDMSVRLNKNTNLTGISQIIEKIHNPALRNIIHVSNEKAVSSDFIGDRHSCTLDMDSSMQLSPNFFKLICWYENEYSYSCRVVDTILFLERQLQARIPSRLSSLSFTSPLPFKTLRRLRHTDCNERNRSRECNPFRDFLDNLQNSRSKRSSHSLQTKPSIAHGSTIHQVGYSNEARKRKETIKTYIDQLTKCNCNALQNKTHILKTCVDPPAEGTERARAQNCIKRVEKEITAMLNMIEDLLNKSNNKKIHSSPEVKHVSKEATEKELSTLRENIITKIADTIDKLRKEKHNVSNVEVCGDHKSLILLDVDDYQEKANASKSEMDSLNNYSLKLEEPISSTKLQKENIVCSNPSLKSSTFVIQKFNYSCDPWVTNKNLRHLLSKHINKSHITDDLTLQIVKENKSLTKGLAEPNNSSLVDDSADLQEKDELSEEVILIISEPDNESERISHNEVKSIALNEDVTGKEIVNIPNSDIIRKVEALTIKTIKEHEPPVAYTSSYKIEDNDKDTAERADGRKEGENSSQGHPGCSSTQTLRHKYFNNSIDNTSEGSSVCVPLDCVCTSDTKKTCDTCKNTEDIYDKLDSNSVSESENSFQIHEKTSQVINITDLTYSLEDLGRLDKICRVIEISDELSDKLFSPLDSENHQNKPTHKWSFQDLCERIKFDEFCNELFDKSPL